MSGTNEAATKKAKAKVDIKPDLTPNPEGKLPKKARGIENVKAGRNRLVIEAVTFMNALQLRQIPENITMFNSNIKNADFMSMRIVVAGEGVTDYKVGDNVQLDELLRSHYLHIDDNHNSLKNVAKLVKDLDSTSVVKDINGKAISYAGRAADNYKVVEYFVVMESNILIAWDN